MRRHAPIFEESWASPRFGFKGSRERKTPGRDDDVYAAGNGGERPERAGRTGAGSSRWARDSAVGRASGGARKGDVEAGGKRFATAHAAHACSCCGTKGACAGWSGAKSCVPCERISRPSTWPKAPPSASCASRATTAARLRRPLTTGKSTLLASDGYFTVLIPM